MLGGMTRMTLTLTTIIVEATQDIALLPYVMLALAVSRAIGDLLTPSFDEGMMKVINMPFLEEEPPRVLEVLNAKDVMATSLVTLRQRCKVVDLLNVLESTGHNGFPVVARATSSSEAQHIIGMIQRHQIFVLLKEKVWIAQTQGIPISDAVREAYVSAFSTRVDFNLDALFHELAEEAAALNFSVDLAPFLDPSPLVVMHTTPLTRVYDLFNLNGIRHLPVVDGVQKRLVGIITRKDMIPRLIELKLSGAAMHRWLALKNGRRRSSSDSQKIAKWSADAMAMEAPISPDRVEVEEMEQLDGLASLDSNWKPRERRGSGASNSTVAPLAQLNKHSLKVALNESACNTAWRGRTRSLPGTPPCNVAAPSQGHIRHAHPPRPGARSLPGSNGPANVAVAAQRVALGIPLTYPSSRPPSVPSVPSRSSCPTSGSPSNVGSKQSGSGSSRLSKKSKVSISGPETKSQRRARLETSFSLSLDVQLEAAARAEAESAESRGSKTKGRRGSSSELKARAKSADLLYHSKARLEYESSPSSTPQRLRPPSVLTPPDSPPTASAEAGIPAEAGLPEAVMSVFRDPTSSTHANAREHAFISSPAGDHLRYSDPS